jgi:hypothetical protein
VFLAAASAATAEEFSAQAVFYSGIGGFPCVRVPSVIAVPGALLAFAECRSFVGDGCQPHGWQNMSTDKQARAVCSRRSLDGGATWGDLITNISRVNASYPTATYHRARKTVIVQFSAWPKSDTPYLSPTVMQITSHDGLTWSEPTIVRGVPPLFMGGCRSDSTLQGHLFFAGYNHPSEPKLHSAFSTSVWGSTDGGDTYTVLGEGIAGGEPQLVAWDETHIDVYLRGNSSQSAHPLRSSGAHDCTGVWTWAPAEPTGIPADGMVLDSVKVGTVGSPGGSVSAEQAAGRGLLHSHSQPARAAPVHAPAVRQVPSQHSAEQQVVWFSAPAGPGGRYNLTIFASRDGGSTWAVAARLYPQYGQMASYSCIEQAGDVLSVLWETSGGVGNCSGLCQIELRQFNVSRIALATGEQLPITTISTSSGHS